MPSYKPQGYSSVSPYLIVDDASRTITFLLLSQVRSIVRQ